METVEPVAITAPWHVGRDGAAHYIRHGKPLCGCGGVTAKSPRQTRTSSNSYFTYQHKFCGVCRHLRSETSGE